MSDSSNPAYQAIHRLNGRYDEIGEQMKDFLARQAAGETPDPDEFGRMLEAQSITKVALAAQATLLLKPLKTVLNESRQ